ncbi:MAG: FAD-dependent oxidoreductase [Bacteroidota bacterium]
MNRRFATIFLLFFGTWDLLGQSYDVVVYGATASGVMAAIAAAEQGMKVILIEPGNHVGGMVTGGLSHTDYGDRTVIGGLALKFYQKVAEHYGTKVFYWRGPEPHIGEQIMRDWLEEAGVRLVFNQRVQQVEKNGLNIQSISLSDGQSLSGKTFIDAGYEGDLMAKAGVSYTWGREGKEQFGESWAGRQPIMQTSHQIDARLSPFKEEKRQTLVPLINPRPLAEIGAADKGVQSYCFRLIATHRAENMLPWTKPKNYQPEAYELARSYYAAKPDGPPLIHYRETLPNGKSDINSSVGISTNLLDGSSWDYPEADYPKRDSIWQWHRDYTLGLAWFLATDPAVPTRIHDYMKTFGLCKDEYVDNEHFPHQLYIRVARRMQGEYVMTQHDLMEDSLKYDAIGMGAYNIDVRHVQRNYLPISRFPDLKYEVYNEGYLSIPVSQYQIPYRSLTPKFSECRNLLVSVCMSGSALAIASIRMEPQYMIMGQAAGIAASMAVQSDLPVQQIHVFKLQQKLLDHHQVLSLEENPYGLWNTEESIVIDNHMKGYTALHGPWKVQESIHPERYEMNYRSLDAGKEGSFEYHPYLFHTGKYAISIWYPSSSEFNEKTQVSIYHNKGEEVLFVNQSKNGGQWQTLGIFEFEKGKRLRLSIQGNHPSHRIVADAVKFDRIP